MAKGERLFLSFYLSPRVLRVIAIVAPVMFAVALGVVDDRLLQPAMPSLWAHVILTVVIGVGAFLFANFIFALLERAYWQLEAQKEQLERQATALAALTEAERQRAEEWKSLFEVGRQVTASPDLEGLLGSIVSRARRLLNTEMACLMLLSGDGDSLYMAAQEGLQTPGIQKLQLLADSGLQGLVLETGRPVIVEDYQADPRLQRRQASLVAEEGLVSLIAVPFSGKERPLGALTVGNRQRTVFSERQAELLEAFANWAAVAADTSRLYDKIESLARLEERERIGMDLHDGVIQSIYAVGLNLEDCVERLNESPADIRPGLERAMDDLNKVIKDIRSYIFDLRPKVSQVTDLPQALAELVRDVRVNTLMDAEVELGGDVAGLLDEEQALALFHIAQEALNNVARHSMASSVRVLLLAEDGRVTLQVEDDGSGFELGEESGRGRQGIRNMNDRARAVGANLTLESERGQGTRVRVELPLAPEKG
ncbi:MAG TPA: GAF domain-containing sensor histidine kinase [Dehalococcoidia bacterium]|nr:GAF domain-containing sensor histidine kinase [Dehalococcoidia bacterium]